MIDIIYRYDPDRPAAEVLPSTPDEARDILEQGNRFFAHMLDPLAGDGERTVRILNVSPHDLGFAPEHDGVPIHRPFAVVVGCADARAPIELILGQGANDIFVIRVAGNVLGDECLASIDYAFYRLADSLRLIVVLGHTGCGAVTSTVEAFLDPAAYLALAAHHQLRSIVDSIFPAVRLAHEALIGAYGASVTGRAGFAAALIETAVAINAAMMASTLKYEVQRQAGERIGVVFGVYDLRSRHIGLPLASRGETPHHTLFDPPVRADEFTSLATDVATGPVVRRLLEL